MCRSITININILILKVERILILSPSTTHEFLFGALAELIDNARWAKPKGNWTRNCLFNSSIVHVNWYYYILQISRGKSCHQHYLKFNLVFWCGWLNSKCQNIIILKLKARRYIYIARRRESEVDRDMMTLPRT